MKTRFTKSGEPKMGTTFGFKMEDGSIEHGTIVGKGMGRGPEGRQGCILVFIEWPDGSRQQAPWPEVKEAMLP